MDEEVLEQLDGEYLSCMEGRSEGDDERILKRFADIGLPRAQYDLAVYYRSVPDDGLSVSWFDAAVDSMRRCPFFVRAITEEDGSQRFTRDYDYVLTYVHRAFEGDPDAMCHVADMYWRGSFLYQSVIRALDWFYNAASTGYGPAVQAISYVFMNGDAGQVFEWNLRKAEGTGDINSMRYLVSAYQDGRGVERSDAESDRWLRKLADLSGDPYAEYVFSCRCSSSGDHATAFEYMRRSASKDYPAACYELARMYEEGQGTVQSAEMMDEFFNKAVELGCPEAMTDLGYMYEIGHRRDRDLAAARRLYSEAAAKGYAPAEDCLSRLDRDQSGKSGTL